MLFVEHVFGLLKEMRWRASAALLLLAVTGFFEGAGILLLIPLLGAVGLDVHQGSVGRLATFVTGTLATVGLAPTLGIVLGVFLSVNVMLSLLRRSQLILAISLEQQVIRQTAQRLYGAIVRMDWLTFTRMRASDLTVALTFESERVGLAASQLLAISVAGVVTAVYVGLAMRLSVAMTTGVFACGAALAVLLRRRTERATKLGAAFSDAMKEFQATITDDLIGMKTIRSFGAEQRSFSRVATLARDVGNARAASVRNHANSTFWLEVGSAGVLSALVFLAVDGLRFQSAALLMLLFLFARIVPRLASLQQNVQIYANTLPSFHRVAELEKKCRAAAELEPATSSQRHLRERIRFESVSFRYAADGPWILSDLDLVIDAGSTVAVVGASGAGKSTVADLLMGLLIPGSGRVLIDGVSLDAEVVGGWRRSVAYVAQDTFLFHDTLRANLRWAVPEATDEEINRSLTMAAADFVFDLPAGLDTLVGDRGVRLSGGERQRIALARAILRHPSLLILDEATSALDSENERRIFEAIDRLHGSLTTVIITHRLSTLAGADRIHVLDAGRVVESGSWAQLTANPYARFSELCRAQAAPTSLAAPLTGSALA